MFVCSLIQFSAIITSTDGTTWSLAANGEEGTIIGYSSNITALKLADKLSDIIYNGNKFIAAGTGRIAMSTNDALTSWSIAEIDIANSKTSPGFILFTGRNYIADISNDASSESLIYNSSLEGNGTSGWKVAINAGTALPGNGGTMHAVAYGDGKLIASATTGTFHGVVIAHEETLD
jgi:hypothetical protein